MKKGSQIFKDFVVSRCCSRNVLVLAAPRGQHGPETEVDHGRIVGWEAGHKPEIGKPEKIKVQNVKTCFVGHLFLVTSIGWI
jgi:hypothetical protein